ncbi:MAG: hypothetical protein ACRERD_21330, partial [Candidatus Binatia bacterium]
GTLANSPVQVCQAAPSGNLSTQSLTESVARAPTVPARIPSPASSQAAPPLPYHDPKSIYQRYVAARDAWYKSQVPGTYVNNKIYRKAQGLPTGYGKASYKWCLDYKQMGKHCVTSTGARDWAREEMMAYLDWDKSENDRFDAQVALELENGEPNRRGLGSIWKKAQQDEEEQEAIYSAEHNRPSDAIGLEEEHIEDCIHVVG